MENHFLLTVKNELFCFQVYQQFLMIKGDIMGKVHKIVKKLHFALLIINAILRTGITIFLIIVLFRMLR